MARPKHAQPVKLFVAMLWSGSQARDLALHRVQNVWGPIDFSGSDYSFDVTDYYRDEMGPELKRRLYSFERLVAEESLREAKLRANEIEQELARNGRRAVNLDVGTLDHSKIVLASAKYAGQKIHLGDGIYADLVARFKDGRYQPFEWTFPDFRDGRYDADLGSIRHIYLEQLRRLRGAA